MNLISLDQMCIGECGIIKKIDNEAINNLDKNISYEIISQILEMGFIEEAKVKVMHKGVFNSPIAVRINNSNNKVVLRKSEARLILVEKSK